MTRRNVYQVSDWNGISGERWVSNQARLDVMLAPFGDAALETAAPQAGERVLDVGCGAGTQTFEIGRQVGPRGHVLALDISTPLVERARQTMPSNLPVTFDVADVSVAPLPVQALDLLYSRFGVMFFDDPVAAFSHMRLSLRPGGRLAFVCWRSAAENDWVRLPMGAIKGIVPPSAPPPADAPGPFSFGDRARVEGIVAAAGFVECQMRPFDHTIHFGLGESRDAAVADAVNMAFEVGPLSRALADQSEVIRERARLAVHSAFAARPGERSVQIEGAAWIVTARNPGL
ncbi:methyltransferase domain-containing protein [Novosphingobium sp. BL-8H]|uniref:class I SAM-dependent methyltransferase n=1 Tax=Novosphingobium sp. BL-8H TaxID=3127640 RepID=UPI00375746F5